MSTRGYAPVDRRPAEANMLEIRPDLETDAGDVQPMAIAPQT
jgi:hypothetical protein